MLFRCLLLDDCDTDDDLDVDFLFDSAVLSST